MINILIMGYGEVGKSLEGLYSGYGGYTVYTKDLYSVKEGYNTYIKNAFKGRIDLLHVSIPYTSDFNKSVIHLANSLQAANDKLLVVIHSTIPVYTTQTIAEGLSDNIFIVHSPVMGVHPNLTESMQTFKKIIGGDKKAVEMAVKHFEKIGIKCQIYSSSNESEAAKLLSTSYYGWNIIFMKNVHKFCEERGLNFDEIYKKTNEIYNEGYEKMGMPHVRRPVLKFIPGKIGGHCLIPNMHIIKDGFYPASLMLKLEEKEK